MQHTRTASHREVGRTRGTPGCRSKLPQTSRCQATHGHCHTHGANLQALSPASQGGTEEEIPHHVSPLLAWVPPLHPHCDLSRLEGRHPAPHTPNQSCKGSL